MLKTIRERDSKMDSTTASVSVRSHLFGVFRGIFTRLIKKDKFYKIYSGIKISKWLKKIQQLLQNLQCY